MREIKFRAWDKKKRRFEHGCSNLVIMLSGHLNWDFGGELKWISELEKDYELNQYTGLLDKQGKEIYEVDIIQWHNGKELIGKPKLVEDTSGGWNPFIDDMQTDGAWHYEVIGNIYENPELLTKELEL